MKRDFEGAIPPPNLSVCLWFTNMSLTQRKKIFHETFCMVCVLTYSRLFKERLFERKKKDEDELDKSVNINCSRSNNNSQQHLAHVDESWEWEGQENEVGIFSILLPRWFETCGVVDQDSQESGPLPKDSSSGETLKDTPLLFCPLLSSYFFHSRYGTVSLNLLWAEFLLCIVERRHSSSWKRPSGRDEEEITVSQFICSKHRP